MDEPEELPPGSDERDHPKREHRRPDGVSDEVVAGLGKLSEALETVERARGHLYGFHQLTGHADLALDEAVELLRSAGETELVERLETELVGRNVIAGRWTFQIVEEHDEGYYRHFRSLEEQARNELVSGRTHLFEAEMKERRRSRDRPGHAARPHEVDPGR